MTAQQIYEIASSYLYEKDSEDADSKHFSVGFLNVLLQESLKTENSIRRYNGETELKSAPYISSLTETIDYSDDITRVALPYGVAAQFFQEAMEYAQAENYRGKYIMALSDAAKATIGQIEDVYGGTV